MDCKSFQENVTAAVDNRLTDHDRAAFAEHAGKCPKCRNEFELESMTKSVVCSRMKMLGTPASVMERVSERLRDEDRPDGNSLRELLRSVWTSTYAKPALAFVVGCVAVILLLRFPNESPSVTVASLGPADIIEQSLANYAKVVNGDMAPDSSDKLARLAGFFRGKTDFPVLVPKMKECNLVGGALNEYAGVKLAHVVYRHDGDVVYMYQACWEEVQKGEKILLPAEAMRELKSTGRYARTAPGGCSIVLWTKGRTLCSAVAHMPSDALIACLVEEEESSGSPW